MPFHHVAYKSDSCVDHRSQNVANIYLQARDNNRRFGITGHLQHHDGQFIQYIEGPEENVRRLLSTIRSDWRHNGMHVFLEGKGPRLFDKWSMAFSDETELSFCRPYTLNSRPQCNGALYRYFSDVSRKLEAVEQNEAA